MGMGKSFLTMYMAANVTTATDWCDDIKNEVPASRVLIGATEDDANNTLLPRFIAAGGDRSKIGFLTPMKVTEFVKVGKEMKMSTQLRNVQFAKDMKRLRAMLKAQPDIAMIVFDPVRDFYGVDSKDDNALSPVMYQLMRLAKDTGIAIVCVSHKNKNVGLDSTQGILGASAFAGSSRAAWEIGKEPDDPDVRHFGVSKFNLGIPGKGLKFKLVKHFIQVDGKEVDAGHIEWLGESGETADSLQERQREKAAGKYENRRTVLAKAFLIGKLADGQKVKFGVLEAGAKAEGISKSALYDGFKALGDAIKTDWPDVKPASWWMPTEAQKKMWEWQNQTMEDKFEVEAM